MFPHITSDPAVLGGKPCIRGTRISVEFILELFASGATRDDILRAYPHLTAEGVEEALRYAARSLKNEVILTAEVTEDGRPLPPPFQGEDSIMTLVEAGKKFDIPYDTLVSACRQGRIKARKSGKIWLTTQAAIKEAIEAGRVRGRKRESSHRKEKEDA